MADKIVYSSLLLGVMIYFWVWNSILRINRQSIDHS